jgi:pyruvate kinase
MKMNAKAIFTLSMMGKTPRAIASFRPGCPIYAITPNEMTARQLGLDWGITPIVVDPDNTPDEMINLGIDYAKANNYVTDDDIVVLGGSDTYDYKNRLYKNDVASCKTLGGIFRI